GNGERVWTMNRLRYRTLTSPTPIGPNVVFGDSEGRLHFHSRQDGSVQARYETLPIMVPHRSVDDGGYAAPYMDTGVNGIAAPPVLAGNTLVVVTRVGRVLGLRPE
ncbi:MAG: outer membrane protein assembly factor BamB, partial [Gammaproteobacteria bacterium]|nr:outer membrane protein assembly factor BamB [Gammaproteobacteria bacterium]